MESRTGLEYTGRQVVQIRVIIEVGKTDQQVGHIRKSRTRGLTEK